MLTQRDMHLINTCDRYGVLTTNQIKALHFSDADKRTMLRRLRDLERYNIVERFEGLPKGKLAWTLDWRGRSLASRGTPVKLTRNSVEHDCMVTAVRMALDKIHRDAYWKSHFEIRSTEAKQDIPETQIPDATFRAEDGRQIALEVELALKSKARYGKIASTYYFMEGIKIVWYVTRTDRQLQSLKKIIETRSVALGRPEYVFSTIDDVLSNLENAKVIGHNKQILVKELLALGYRDKDKI